MSQTVKSRSSELPYEVKERVLEQIKEQIGSTKYYEAVSRYGEDGLIDLTMSSLEDAATASAEKSREGFWKTYGWGIALSLIAFGPLFYGDPTGLVVVGFFLLPPLCQVLGAAVAEWWNRQFPNFR
jgi:hypothetical protein